MTEKIAIVFVQMNDPLMSLLKVVNMYLSSIVNLQILIYCSSTYAAPELANSVLKKSMYFFINMGEIMIVKG